jgi:uroporphyrinogen decarboxylase
VLDNPDLAIRFSDVILRAMLGLIDLTAREAGYTANNLPGGFGFADDNSCLFNPQMHELFGYPILKGVWERCSPKPTDMRFQHSDSAMGHLLPLLGKLRLTGTNFGASLTVSGIRRHLPGGIIEGQLAPFTFSRKEEENMVLEFLRDFDQAREHRGLRFTTAGSVNNGSRLTGMRLIMSAIQHFGRYDS